MKALKTPGLVLNTDGRGHWSSAVRKVQITKMNLGYLDESYDSDEVEVVFGELRVFFARKSWNTEQHGLIYTDEKFLRELRKYLNSEGLPGRDVDYSEQGMQGDNYVSLDVGKKFLKAWSKKLNVDLVALLKKQEQEFQDSWGDDDEL
jgi:hypothetical protein